MTKENSENNAAFASHYHDGRGGAIGSYISVVFYKELSKSQDTLPPPNPRETEYKTLLLHDTLQTAPSRDNEIGRGPMYDFDLEWVHDFTSRKKEHPIYACKRLAKAFEASKAWGYINDNWMRLCRQFTHKLRTTTVGERFDSMLAAAKISLRGLSTRGTIPACDKDSVFVFRGRDGSVIPYNKALYRVTTAMYMSSQQLIWRQVNVKGNSQHHHSLSIFSHNYSGIMSSNGHHQHSNLSNLSSPFQVGRDPEMIWAPDPSKQSNTRQRRGIMMTSAN